MTVTELRQALEKLEAEGKGNWPVTTNDEATKFGEVSVLSERSKAVALLQRSNISFGKSDGRDVL